MKEKMKVWMEELTEETTVTKRELALGAAVCALAGMVVGMLIAKMATGWSFSIMSNNGNNNGNDNGNYNPDGGEDVCEPKDENKCK
ncbi:MAG: hypothetical protein K2N41_07685 [Lachnospiraceae bacterium]|nr:hypothetical protein [Lachnospiraceae bacterium]MDE7239578.1 hypothetical protein [Lachnospiraceae bacterium]